MENKYILQLCEILGLIQFSQSINVFYISAAIASLLPSTWAMRRRHPPFPRALGKPSEKEVSTECNKQKRAGTNDIGEGKCVRNY